MEMEKLYDHKKCDALAQELWAREKVYNFVPTDPAKVFSIDTPPPTVSGSLHIGHIFSYTHADLVARYKRMRGYHVFYPMGFDDNGLPTERFVEKKHATRAHLMKRSEFIDLCLRETATVEKLFEDLWRRMGLSIDWTKTYSTISTDVRRISQQSFIDLYNKGLVYRKQEPSLYCTTCRTSVAQAELDSAEVTTTFNDLVFVTEEGEKLTISTTRPELLPSCVAVFFNPDDIRYKHLLNRFAITPIFEKPVRILADEKVDPAKGTGLVMCCTFGDQTDIYWYKTYKLPFVQAVGFDGKWTPETGPLAGLAMRDARKKAIELLKESEKLVGQKTITHSVTTHERCKQEIEYLVLQQWFIKILDHKEEFLKRADEIEWKPAFMKARYLDWVQNLHWDWGISRQRFFGIPFPIWHCRDCERVVCADTQYLPIDPQEQSFPGGKCPHCSSSNLVPDTDVMDTWNTSSLTPLINLHWPEKSPDKLTLPMSMRPQAHDIIRTWAFYTIVKAHFHCNTAPWKTIMISGHVLAGKEKISKSQENSKMAPEELLQQFSADAIRYWSASGRLGTDTAFSENQLKIGQRLVTKLWNAFRFIEEHLREYTPQAQAPSDCLNQWLMHALGVTYARYQELFDAYEYQAALEVVEKFFWSDFCDNYLELVKDRLFNPANHTPEEIEATKHTLYNAGFGILQLFAPFVPHVTEQLYQLLFKTHEKTISLHATLLDDKRFVAHFDASYKSMTTVLAVVASVRKLKSVQQVSLKKEIDTLVIHTNDQSALAALRQQWAVILGVTKAKHLEFSPEELANDQLAAEGEKTAARIKI
ncbi:MAG: valine--tRNA ligase [Candidatus Babeliales bacterium]|jgi:valyl-tRNA synthetase